MAVTMARKRLLNHVASRSCTRLVSSSISHSTQAWRWSVSSPLLLPSRFTASHRLFSTIDIVDSGNAETPEPEKKKKSNNESSNSLTPQLEPTHYISRSERAKKGGVFKFDPIFKDRLVKANRTSPTREVNFTQEYWESHKGPWRKFRHLLHFFHSSPFRRLAYPDLIVTASIATGLSIYNTFLAADISQMVMTSGAVVAGGTTAIGLLGAFRLNESYGRFDEGRKFWGEINNSSRDLAGNACMFIEDPAQKERMLRLIQVFPVVMQWHLNEKGGHYLLDRNHEDFGEQKYAEWHAEVLDVYRGNEKDPDFIHFCTAYRNGGHLPLAVTSTMRNIIANNHKEATVDPTNPNRVRRTSNYNREMDEQVSRLVGCMGMCERVLRTPLPTCYTRHTSRLMLVWANSLPFAMYPVLGPIGVIPGSVIMAYTVLAIEDVGVQMEEPFNILPLRQYSDGIFDGINGIRANYDLSEKTPQKDSFTPTSSL